VIITSTNEKELPDAFLAPLLLPLYSVPRDGHHCAKIVEVTTPRIKDCLADHRINPILRHPRSTGLKKKPSTSESAFDWLNFYWPKI